MASNVKMSKSTWWLGTVAGVATLLFGIAALFWPGLTLVTFVYIFSAYVLAWGIVSVIEGFSTLHTDSLWWLKLLFGVLAVGVGVYLVRHPGVSFATLILLTGFTFIVRGLVDIVSGLFGGEIAGSHRVLTVVAGVLGLIAGVFILSQPVAGGVAFVWIIGLYALIVGPVLIAGSMEERALGNAVV